MVARMPRRPRSDEPHEGGWEPDDPGFETGGDADPGSDDDGLDAHDLADRRRFASAIAYCPECGAELHDSADICPACFAWVTDETIARPRTARRLRFLVAWILIAALLVGAGLLGIVRLVV